MSLQLASARPIEPDRTTPWPLGWARLATRTHATLALGLTLMATALLLQWRWLAPWREAIAVAEAGALARPAPPPAWSRLPAAADAPQRSAQLLQQAVRQGLQVHSSRERLDGPGASLVLEMQALGHYVDLRRFLAFALANDAALALEGLQVRHETGPEGRLRFELRWRLLHQPARTGVRP